MNTINIFNEDSMSDNDLIEKIKNGDQRAFTVIFDRYSSKLRSSLLSKNSAIRNDEAEDYVADAFIQFYDNVNNGKYRHKGTLFNYLYTIAHRLYLKHIGRYKEDVTEDDRLNRIYEQIFVDAEERDQYISIVNEILKELTIGKNEKELKCSDLLYAQYGIPKIKDEDFYSEHPEKFTNELDVRRKRNKCMERLRKLVKENIITLQNS